MKAWFLMVLALSAPVVMANEGGGEKEDPNKVSYVALTPPLVGNFALDGSPKLHVYKADVALRVTGAEAQKVVKTNEPLIRNQLVALFTQQTVASMNDVDAKEKLRQEALKQTQEVLTQETGKPVVEDLLFNNFIAQ